LSIPGGRRRRCCTGSGARILFSSAAGNLPEEDAGTSDRTSPEEGLTQRLPILFAQLKFGLIDDEMRFQIEPLEGNGSLTLNKCEL
jgi:hypothetical protein